MSAATKQDVHPAFMQVNTLKKGEGNSRSAGEAAEADCINEGVSFFVCFIFIDIVVHILDVYTISWI